ncbi:Vacuolar protein sorting-associated protein 45 [Fasciola gigantica]|uniref:Vacuolar protein sorting-associated protein 45 n=1 Tax=Fasciola gigantica TaxID=46835 RepID=A0A504YUR0_FASGI|nr:Vacuolar protein sorting-associated protein 45 [Fasciola gigantica]
MDVYLSVKMYLSKMLSVAGSGMKVLLLDDDTLKTTSLVSSMSEIMKQEVYLIDRIQLPREPLEHLRCICFLRPTKENITLLSQELRKPNYFTYYIFFSHSLTKQLLKQLAEADEHEVVAEVHEYFADFMPLSPFIFELDLPSIIQGSRDLRPGTLERCMEGITSVLLALKQCPVIRYQNASESARHLAESVRSLISRETVLFEFKPSDNNSVLLIVDRRQDPVTPLLTQWTYEAMIHELLGIRQNRVDLSRSPTVRPELKEVSLNREFDEFFRANQHANFGEIGQSIKKLVEEFQAASKSVDTKNVESISDLKKFLEHYPSFRKASGTVETHVTIVSELSRLVKEHALLELSEAEQELVCHDNHSASFSQIRGLIHDPRVRLSDAVRLVLLYALRYENQKNELKDLIRLLMQRGASEDDVHRVQVLLDYTGPRTRSDGFTLFGAMKNVAGGSHTLNGQSASSAVASLTKRLVKGLKGVDNVYTQHEPLLSEILNDLLRGKLRDTAFPFLSSGTSWVSVQPGQRPRTIIVFVIGGATYEEAYAVHKLNATTPDVDIILGGTFMHNSRTFLEDVCSGALLNHSGHALQDTSTQSSNVPSRSFGKERTHVRYNLLKSS